MKYPVGYKFIDRNNRICEVIDYLTTTNLNGDITQQRYVTRRELLGQSIIDRDTVQATIDMGKPFTK